MILSHAKRFVMFLPWKTGSQTLIARLQDFNDSPYDGMFRFQPHLNRVVHYHLTLSDFQALPESRLGYFLAWFVRNPYDRAYSGFVQLQRDLERQPDLSYTSEWIRRLVMQQLDETRRQIEAADGEFDNWLALIDEYQVFEAGRNTNFLLHPAHYWTHLNGTQAVDFIGRVESFEDDLRAFADLMGLSELAAVNANVSEPDSWPSSVSAYRYTDRMSAASIERINQLFAADFEYFGYEKIEPGAVESELGRAGSWWRTRDLVRLRGARRVA
jgi:hypothetical protein